MELTAMEFGGAVIFVLQLLLLFVNLKVRGDLAELKVHMYQNFVTKKDLQTFINTGVVARE